MREIKQSTLGSHTICISAICLLLHFHFKRMKYSNETLFHIGNRTRFRPSLPSRRSIPIIIGMHKTVVYQTPSLPRMQNIPQGRAMQYPPNFHPKMKYIITTMATMQCVRSRPSPPPSNGRLYQAPPPPTTMQYILFRSVLWQNFSL